MRGYNKEVKALEQRLAKIDEFIFNNYESKMSISELAECNEKAFIKACKEWDKAHDALIALTANVKRV